MRNIYEVANSIYFFSRSLPRSRSCARVLCTFLISLYLVYISFILGYIPAMLGTSNKCWKCFTILNNTLCDIVSFSYTKVIENKQKTWWCEECTRFDPNISRQNFFRKQHWHVFTWIWETYLAWYQQVVFTGREMGAGRSLSHWIIESAVYLQPIKMLILSTELFSVLTQSGWYFALCIAWCSQQWWLILISNAFWTTFLFL